MKILGIETSSSIFSLCLSDDEHSIYEFSRLREFEGHKDALIFEEAKHLIESMESEKVGAIAVSIGPGMFTSLRVGLCLAKGLAIAHNTPVVAVNTLDVIGVRRSLKSSPLVAVINAYRGELYAAFYDSGARTSDYLLTTPAGLSDMIQERTLAVGPGLDVFKAGGPYCSNLDFLTGEKYLPNAPEVVALAWPRIKAGDFDDVSYLEPYYIKKTDAERKYDQSDAV